MANNREFEYLLRLRADTSQAANAIRNFTSTLGGRGGQNPLSAFAQNAQSVSGGIGRIGTAAQQNIPRVNNFSRALQSLFPNLSKFAGLISETAVVYGIKQAAIWTGELTLQYERLNAKLLFTFTNQERVNRVLNDTRERANFLGQNFVTLTDQYASFAAASKGTTLSSKEVENLFFGVAKAGAALQLSNEGLRGSLFAIQQMMSKGKVNSEEFRLQLAERMPIALLAATRATGLTTKQFTLMLESGKILSDQFLPKFAKELENLAEGSLKFATTSLPAELERTKNAVRELALSFGSAATTGVKDLVVAIGQLTSNITGLGTVLGKLFGGVSSIVSVFGSVAAAALEGWRSFGIFGEQVDLIAQKSGHLVTVNKDVSRSIRDNSNSWVDLVKKVFSANLYDDIIPAMREYNKQLQEINAQQTKRNNEKAFQQTIDDLIALGKVSADVSRELSGLPTSFEESFKGVNLSSALVAEINAARKVGVDGVEKLADAIGKAYGVGFGGGVAIVNSNLKDGIVDIAQLREGLKDLEGTIPEDAIKAFETELRKLNGTVYNLQNGVQTFAQKGGLSTIYANTTRAEDEAIRKLREQGFKAEEIKKLVDTAKSIDKDTGLNELSNANKTQNKGFLAQISENLRAGLESELKLSKSAVKDLDRVISDATRTIENALDSGLGAQSKGDRIRLKTQAQINDIQNAIALLQGAGAKLTKEQAAYLSGTKGLVEAILFNGNKEADKADADAFIEKMRQSKSAIENVQGAMAEIQKKSVEAGTGIAEAFERGFDSALDSMADFIVTGKLSFGSFLQDMARMLAKSGLRTLFAQGIFPALNAAAGNGSIVSKIFSGFGVLHTGGRVGSPTSRTVSADPSLFANAPRFHTGLRPDEFPAILQRGETVIPRNQTSMGGGSSVNNVNVSINVDGPAAAAAGADPKATQKLTKELGYQVEEAVLQAIQKHNRPGGSLYSGKGRY